MKKGQNTIEFIIVVLFFIIVIVFLMTAYLKLFPSEASKIREQVACSQAEAAAIQLLELQGQDTNWDSTGDLTELGFSTETALYVNYSKIATAKSRGYYNITTDANLSIPFKLSYEAYAINFSTDEIPEELSNETTPSVFLVRNRNSLLVYAGSNSTPVDFSMTLFFPFANIIENNCSLGTLEAGDTNTTTEELNGNKSILRWSVGAEDLDCINFTLTEVPDLIFIKSMSLRNPATRQDYPIYLHNSTILNGYFGSSGDIDKDKSFCEVERVGLLINDDDGEVEDEQIPVRFKVMSWR